MDQWIKAVVTVGLAVSALKVLLGDKSKAFTLLCSAVFLCTVIMPIPDLLKDIPNEPGEYLNISYPENDLNKLSGEELVSKEALRLLENRLSEEIARRFCREDFSIVADSDGAITLTVDKGSDFPAEEARLVLGVLLPGARVEVMEN